MSTHGCLQRLVLGIELRWTWHQSWFFFFLFLNSAHWHCHVSNCRSDIRVPVGQHTAQYTRSNDQLLYRLTQHSSLFMCVYCWDRVSTVLLATFYAHWCRRIVADRKVIRCRNRVGVKLLTPLWAAVEPAVNITASSWVSEWLFAVWDGDTVQRTKLLWRVWQRWRCYDRLQRSHVFFPHPPGTVQPVLPDTVHVTVLLHHCLSHGEVVNHCCDVSTLISFYAVSNLKDIFIPPKCKISYTCHWPY